MANVRSGVNENGMEFESALIRQTYFINKIREINNSFYKEKPKMFIKTFGCQMNFRDSEKIAGILDEMGYESALYEKDADFVILNTCCIRENAENRVLGNLGRLKYYKERNKNLKVALCGCMVQQDGAIEVIKKKYRGVDILFGTHNFHKLPELMYTNITTEKPVIDIWETHDEIVEDLPSARKYKWKAAVNIMYGCDNFCAYCIVPYVRGRERSRSPDEILNEIESLAKDGARELLLLGQNVNSYGLHQKVTFAELLRKINDVGGIERIRFMTPHPKDFSYELIDAIALCDNVCPHIHLPMQSGSTEVLSKMNRKYSKDHFLKLAENIKRAVPEVCLTTDIIVGFPGETDEDFSDTMHVVKTVRFSGAYTFIYSKRAGTPAANMEPVNDVIVKDRFEKLLSVQNKITEEINESFVGKTVKVLVDELNKKESNSVSGRNEYNTLVHFDGGNELLGKICNVKITRSGGFFLEGKMIGGIS